MKIVGTRGTPDHFFQCLRKQETKKDGFIEANESLKQTELTASRIVLCTWIPA